MNIAPTNRSIIRSLEALNFFMADLQAGIGHLHRYRFGDHSFLTKFLASQHITGSSGKKALTGRTDGHNQAYNHAGNVAGAALSGWLGYRFGMPAIFLLAALFGVLSVVSVLLIPTRAIDDQAARGLEKDDGSSKASGLKVLVECKPLLILAAALAFFHLGNGAMLPLYGLAAAGKHQGNPSVFVAMTIVIAQPVMVVASLVAMRMAEKRGYWLVILISFLALPIRGLIAAHWINHTGLYPVQILDGIGAGLQSVAVPGLGASLSPAIGGWLAQEIGYPSTFLLLGALALVSIAFWCLYAPMLRKS
jgi:MFS family permease